MTSTLPVTFGAKVDVDGIVNCAIQMETVLHSSEGGDKVDRCTLKLQMVPEEMYSRSQRAIR